MVLYNLAPSSRLHSEPQSSPWHLTFEVEPQYSAPTRSIRRVDKPLRLGSEGQHPRSVQVSLLCPQHTCCCALLRGSKAPSLSPPVRGLPSVWKPFLLHISLPKVQLPSQFLSLSFFFFFVFCLTQLLGDFLALLGV